MKRIIKSFLLSILLGLTSVGVIYFINVNFLNNNKVNVSINNKPVATITGAVEEPGDYVFQKNQTMREIIFQAKVKSTADLCLLSLEAKQVNSFEIDIPYQIGENPKLQYSKIKTISQMKAFGIKESIAKILIKYKNENKGIPTWNEIDNLPGIGEKTLSFLKKNLELS